MKNLLFQLEDVAEYFVFLIIGQFGYKIKGDVWKRADPGNLDKTEDYYELAQQGSDLFLVSVEEPPKLLK